MIKCFKAKLGSMRKEVDWIVYPVSTTSDPELIKIQSDKQICSFDKTSGKGVLRSGKKIEAVNVPAEVIAAAIEAQPKSGDQIGPGCYVA